MIAAILIESNREYTASVSPLTAPLTSCQKITMKRKRRKRRSVDVKSMENLNSF